MRIGRPLPRDGAVGGCSLGRERICEALSLKPSHEASALLLYRG